MKEYLGYSLEAYSLDANSLDKWGEDIALGHLDIDIENEKAADKNSADHMQYITGDDASVANLGEVGYTYRKGLYVTPGVLQTHPMATWYMFYSDTSAFQAAHTGGSTGGSTGGP